MTSLTSALELIRRYGIRHLPVQEAGRVIGMLSDRDIKLASSFSHAHEFKMEEVMAREPYIVIPQTPLDRAVLEMVEHKHTCAFIQQADGELLGTLTAADGLRTLGEVVRSQIVNR